MNKGLKQNHIGWYLLAGLLGLLAVPGVPIVLVLFILLWPVLYLPRLAGFVLDLDVPDPEIVFEDTTGAMITITVTAWVAVATLVTVNMVEYRCTEEPVTYEACDADNLCVEAVRKEKTCDFFRRERVAP